MTLLRCILIASLVLIISCAGRKPILIEDTTSSGQVRYSVKIGRAKEKIYQGVYTAWYPNGAKKLEVTYNNGKNRVLRFSGMHLESNYAKQITTKVLKKVKRHIGILMEN